jgi:hypothetical protein
MLQQRLQQHDDAIDAAAAIAFRRRLVGDPPRRNFRHTPPPTLFAYPTACPVCRTQTGKVKRGRWGLEFKP